MKTKQELISENERLSHENGLYLLYLHDMENHVAPDAVSFAAGRERGTGVHGLLFRAKSGHGGYVVITYEYENGERMDAHIYYLEELMSKMRDNHSEHTLALRIVLEKLYGERNYLLDRSRDELRGRAGRHNNNHAHY